MTQIVLVRYRSQFPSTHEFYNLQNAPSFSVESKQTTNIEAALLALTSGVPLISHSSPSYMDTWMERKLEEERQHVTF